MPAPPTAIVAVIALLGGAAAGVGLERAGVLSPLAEPEAAVVRADRVAVLDCPEGSVLTALGRGDRVLATGRSADDEWVEIRSPLDLDARAWLPVGVVSGDEGEGDLADLPVRECEERGGPTTSTSSTTTSSTSTSTSTTLLEETTTTEPPEDTTTRPTTTTSTTVDTPPAVTSLTANPNPIGNCGQTTITAVTTSDATAVALRYFLTQNEQASQIEMTRVGTSNTWRFTTPLFDEPFPAKLLVDVQPFEGSSTVGLVAHLEVPYEGCIPG